MHRSLTIGRVSQFSYRVPATAALATSLLAGAALGDKILVVSDHTLTDYRAATTGVQGARPLPQQRGAHLDGTLHHTPLLPFAIPGNPVGEGWNANAEYGQVRLDTGTFLIEDVDLSLPAPGFRWTIGRTYNVRQMDDVGDYFDSDGPQGRNWFQTSQPELVYYDYGSNGTDDEDDAIYLVFGADRYIEFRRVRIDEETLSDDTFRAVNGAAGVILITEVAEGPDLWTYHGPNGYEITFFGINDADIVDAKEGQLWKIVDAAGNIAHVGDSTGDDSSATDALADGFYTGGEIKYVLDTADRRYYYQYDGNGRLTSVTVQKWNGSSWADQDDTVTYSYYVNADTHGQDGDLKLVTVTRPMSVSGDEVEFKTYYRYYEGTYDADTNPGNNHHIKYIYESEGLRSFDYAEVGTGEPELDNGFLTASEADLKAYASAYFEYEDSDATGGDHRRITEAWFNGECGCGSSGSTGTYTYTYATSGYTNNAGYDDDWAYRTVMTRPDGSPASRITQYFDEVGQPLSRVITKGDPAGSPTNTWATYVDRDDTSNDGGWINSIHTPANVTGYTHSTGAFTTSTTAGLVIAFGRVNNTFGIDTDLDGFIKDVEAKEGTNDGTPDPVSGGCYPTSATTKTVGDFEMVGTAWAQSSCCSYWPETHVNFGNEQTISSLTPYGGSEPITVKQVDVSYPTVTTANNGPDSSTSESHYFNKDGTLAFSKSTEERITYRGYTNGLLTTLIEDADTAHADFTSITIPTGFASSGTEFHRKTTYTYDERGRVDTITMPDGRVLKHHYSHLKDGRLVTLQYADYEGGGTPKFYGPVQYTVSNQAGQTVVSATVELTDNSGEYTTDAVATHIDETDDDPLLAIAGTSGFGTVARLSTSVYDETGGKVVESRAYFAVPASGAGTSSANYDPITYDFDDMGRVIRVVSADGTIQRTVYDARGNVTEQKIGTNDEFVAGTDDLVTTMLLEYDGGADGKNGLLTEQTARVQSGSTGERVTTFTYDYKGQLIVQENPQAPHILHKYDDRGRVVATGLYSSASGLAVGDDPTSEATNRVGLTQSFYDEMGRVWKSQQHKIDASDGSDDDNLQTLTWYDAAGRVIKQDGQQLVKSLYDRIGRQTHQFILVKDDDTTYAHAADVTGDIVAEEHQTVYESAASDEVVMVGAIERHHDDYGSGETTDVLDTNADSDPLKYTAADIDGRIQITAHWYDRLGRVADTVAYGTNGGSDFNRGTTTTPPARSATALRTTYVYNPDGSLLSVTDPGDKQTRYEYDDLGRQTKITSNYVDGSPGGGTNDDQDQVITYTYTDGLMVTMTADLAGSSDDQVTTYTYGVSTAQTPASTITANHLLREVKYPDSASGTDVVLYAYNAQGQRLAMDDQLHNLIETEFDTAGRATKTKVTTLASGVDGAVRRIERAYDSLSRPTTVTQYDASSGGNVVDEVKYTYESWGFISKFEQDHNSTVATGGTLLYDVEHSFEKVTSGRNTIRRTGMTTPSGRSVTFDYTNAGTGTWFNEISRVRHVVVDSVTVATYRYNGVGHLVGTTYNEADVFSRRYGGSSLTQLDRFNRPTDWTWTKDLSTDRNFVDRDIAWDENSNVIRVEDNIHVGRDMAFSNDALNRLIMIEQGTWSGSAITSRTFQELWTLTPTGNWDLYKLDLNGNNTFSDSGDLNDDRTHNKANELTARDTDDNGTDNYTLVHDAAGNLREDGANYKFTYDAFGRLRKVLNKADGLVAEYWYNGLGYRIAAHQDTDSDGDVDGNDTIVRFIYDERWRVVATYHDSDGSPKSEFIHHNAGLDGRGGSSYIDSVILRDRDASGDPSVMEERVYFCQNWRHDVVAIVSDTGKMLEWVDYTPYGMPYGRPAGDTDSDYDWDATDSAAITGGYDVRKDANLDGVIDANDVTHANSITGGYQTLDRTVLSSTGVRNTLGYAGYVADANLTGKWHVRHRVLDSELGRWLTRDPWGYVDASSLYQYLISNPTKHTDTWGLQSESVVPAPRVAPGRWRSIPPDPPKPGEIAPNCHKRFMRRYEDCLNNYTPGEIEFSACVRAAVDWLADCHATEKYNTTASCFGRLYDPDRECCEFGQVAAMEPLWLCKRPMPGVFGTVVWYLQNICSTDIGGIGRVTPALNLGGYHMYVCCDGANRNCYGKQSWNKAGQPIPVEMLAVGTCTRHSVCPSVKSRKCNNPVCREDYWGIGANCQDWAKEDVD